MALQEPLTPFDGFKTLRVTTIQTVGGIRCHICQLTFGNKKEYDSHYTNHCNGQEITYTCVVCLKEFPEYPKFRDHCYKHVIKDKYKCIHCDKVFSKQVALDSHINSLHYFKCSTCQEEFSSKKELKVHEFIHRNDNPPYKCLSCNDDIMTGEQCEEHIDKHSEFSYPCLICDEIMTNKQDAPKHFNIHFNYMKEELDSDFDDEQVQTDSSLNLVGGILCIYCKEVNKTRSEFLNHLSWEHEDKPEVYGCRVCLKEISTYSIFINHCYHHLSKDKFQCEVCHKGFDRLPRLVLHMEAFHTIAGEKPFKCIHCSSAFQTEIRLRNHLRICHDTRTLTCPMDGCKQVFDTPKALILHQKVHKNTENRCRFCGLQLISMSACLRHLDLHCKTIFSCPVCDRKYGEKYLLKKHMTCHFEAVIHFCKICGKSYTARNRFVAHLKTHSSSLKLHSCSFCGKGFARKMVLEHHLNVHSGTKPFKCQQCQKTFAGYPNWAKHVRKVHNYEGKLRDLLQKTGDSNKARQATDIDENNIQVKDKQMIQKDEIATFLNDELFDSASFTQDPGNNNVDMIGINKDDLIEMCNVHLEDYMFSDNGWYKPAATETSPWSPELGPEFPDLPSHDINLPHMDPRLATLQVATQHHTTTYL